MQSGLVSRWEDYCRLHPFCNKTLTSTLMHNRRLHLRHGDGQICTEAWKEEFNSIQQAIFFRLITYQGPPVWAALPSDTSFWRFNIVKIEHPEACIPLPPQKKQTSTIFLKEKDIRETLLHCWSCREGPSIITELDLFNNTSMFNTLALPRFIKFVIVPCGGTGGGSVFIVFPENSALVLTSEGGASYCAIIKLEVLTLPPAP